MLIFSSTTVHKVDAKGRVSVPAAYRNLTERVSGDKVFFVTTSLKRKCLVGYAGDYVARINEKFERLEEDEPSQQQDDDQEMFFGEGSLLEYDKNGRINLPAKLSSYAEIADECVFVGRGGYFEIRAPHIHEAIRSAAIARKLGQMSS